MNKTALVLGGGGSRGAYQLGVWKALRELNVNIDIVAGTSIGAMNGALVAQGDYHLCEELWNDIKFEMMVSTINSQSFDNFSNMKTTFKEVFTQVLQQGGMDVTPMEELIRSKIIEDKLRNSPIDYGLVTVQLPYLKEIALDKSQIPQGKLADYVTASAACFPAFKSKGIDDVKYVDGGYRNNLPMDLAVSMGADKIIAVDLEGFVLNNIPKVEGVPIRYIRSYWHLGLFLNVDKDVVSRNVALGYLDTMQAFGKYEGFAYSFNLGEKEKFYSASAPYIVYLERLLGINLKSPKDKENNPIIRNRMIKALNRKVKGRVNLAEYSQRAGEIAAELMGVDPTILYTRKSLNTAILQKYASQIDISTVSMEEAFVNPASLKKAGKTLSDYERQQMVNYIYGVIDKRIKTSSGEILFKTLATIYPKEFIGAMYIYGLNNSIESLNRL